MAPHMNISNWRSYRQDEAINIDHELFDDYQFSVDQLMELAGLSVASVIQKEYPVEQFLKVVIVCGPGNNGGDGFVAGRHLKLFGYDPLVVYPKPASYKVDFYDRLLHQLKGNEIPVQSELPADLNIKYQLIVDAVFGFSYKPPIRQLFRPILEEMRDSKLKLVSVDIPSGWDVENGPPSDDTPELKPDCLISLTAPKLCAQWCGGIKHYLGGRFVPDKLAQKYKLNLPDFPDSRPFTLLPST